MGRISARPFIPRAAVSTSPLQHSKMPSFGSICTCPFIPWAAIGTSPIAILHDGLLRLQLSTSFSSHGQPLARAHCNIPRCPPRAAYVARHCIPRATVCMSPLQYFKVASQGCFCARPFIPRTLLSCEAIATRADYRFWQHGR